MLVCVCISASPQSNADLQSALYEHEITCVFKHTLQVAEHQAACQAKQEELDELMLCLGQETTKVGGEWLFVV